MPTVCLIRPPGYPHAEALAELEETVRYGLEALGQLHPPRRIVLGAHLPGYMPEAGDIIYNTEHPRSGWWSAEYRDLMRSHETWDYAPEGYGLHVPIGYMPQLTRIPKADPQDIDVLFYGSMNERRAKVVHDLEAAGLNVVTVFGCYGAERDALIARSKVVLNMHYYEPGVFEYVRMSYLWANRKCIVCECPPPGFMYNKLVDGCRYYVSHPNDRIIIEGATFGAFSGISEVDILREALCVPR